MKTNFALTAPVLRIVLSLTIVLLIILSAVATWFVHDQLSTFANEVNTDNATAASSEHDITKLQQVRSLLDKNQVDVARAKSIVADSKNYQYQNQIIEDLSTYAKTAGFTISGFSFEAVATTTAVPTVPAATAAAPAAVGTAAPVPAGLTVIHTTVTFPPYLEYSVYMNFLKLVEDNLTKMEITGISLQLDQNNGQVSPGPITIGVYVR